jgi:hypothetical protein
LRKRKVEEAWTGQLNAKNITATDEVLKERAKMIASTVQYYSIQSSSFTYLVINICFFILNNFCEFKR